MNDLKCSDCPTCTKISNVVVPQMFSAINATPKTLGGLSDYNRSHMSQAEYDDTVKKMADDRKQLTQYKGYIPEGGELKPKDSFKRPWWRPESDYPDTKLNKMTEEQTVKYVLENKKPIGL